MWADRKGLVLCPLTKEELRKVIHYDPYTGVFTRLDGSGCGYIMNTGYREISVQNKKWLAHRLAFVYMEDYLPKYVDHINQVKDDNRWCNLRECSHVENMRNTKVRTTSLTGERNVHLHKKSGLYGVTLRINGKVKSFGYYKDLELASLVAKEARDKHYGKFKGI